MTIPLEDKVPESDPEGEFDMEKSHRLPLSYHCPICRKPFPTEVQLEEHQKINAHYARPA